MVVPRIRLSNMPVWGAAGAGLTLLLGVWLLPADLLAGVFEASGIALLIPAAAPPLGVTARVMLGIGGGVSIAAVTWAALFLLFGPGGVFAREGGDDGMPEVRSADAHPDAPARRPLSAAELGVPAPSPEAAPAQVRTPTANLEPLPIEAPIVQPLPADLDQPLAAFHPGALQPEPRAPARPVPPLASAAPTRATPLQPGERIESVELPHRQGPDAPSIDALLARLERGTRRAQQLKRA